MVFFITGSAGFIGFHLSKRLIDLGYEVYSIDNLNSYYDISFKKKRLKILSNNKNFHFQHLDINSKDFSKYFKKINPNYLIHLAAQPGVQYSIKNPKTYIKNNISGFLNVLEVSKNIKKLIYASSSSVYGNSSYYPFNENHTTDEPKNIYAVSKKSNELMAHVFQDLYNINTIGLRFFTVYGPWGRPDMAILKFIHRIVNNQEITIYDNGQVFRDFTYIDDVVDRIIKITFGKNNYAIYNIGCGKPIKLIKLIKILEKLIGKQVILNYEKLPIGEINKTYSDNERFISDFKLKKTFNIELGLSKTLDWYYKNSAFKFK